MSFKVLLGDFGLSDLIGIEPVFSRSIDVFNFGIFVLEVVVGRKRRVAETGFRGFDCDSDGSGLEEMDLLDYVWIMYEKDEKMKMVDRKMGFVIDLD